MRSSRSISVHPRPKGKKVENKEVMTPRLHFKEQKKRYSLIRSGQSIEAKRAPALAQGLSTHVINCRTRFDLYTHTGPTPPLKNNINNNPFHHTPYVIANSPYRPWVYSTTSFSRHDHGTAPGSCSTQKYASIQRHFHGLKRQTRPDNGKRLVGRVINDAHPRSYYLIRTVRGDCRRLLFAGSSMFAYITRVYYLRIISLISLFFFCGEGEIKSFGGVAFFIF